MLASEADFMVFYGATEALPVAVIDAHEITSPLLLAGPPAKAYASESQCPP